MSNSTPLINSLHNTVRALSAVRKELDARVDELNNHISVQVAIIQEAYNEIKNAHGELAEIADALNSVVDDSLDTAEEARASADEARDILDSMYMLVEGSHIVDSCYILVDDFGEEVEREEDDSDYVAPDND